jgi:hypothetical protein
LDVLHVWIRWFQAYEQYFLSANSAALFEYVLSSEELHLPTLADRGHSSSRQLSMERLWESLVVHGFPWIFGTASFAHLK